MSKKWYAERISTGQLSDKSIFQLFKINSNQLLLSTRVQLCVFNSPIFTGLKGHIYSVQNNAPVELIATSSNSFDAADISTQANGIREIYFEFNPPKGIKLNGSTFYALVLSATTYVGDETTHIGWVKAWPQPAYPTNFTANFENLLSAPKTLALFGAST